MASENRQHHSRMMVATTAPEDNNNNLGIAQVVQLSWRFPSFQQNHVHSDGSANVKYKHPYITLKLVLDFKQTGSG